MSKQPSRQASKQGQPGQTTNKQSNNQSSKQTAPASKQTTNAAVKQNRPADKQAVNVSVKQTNPSNKPLTRQAAKQARRQQQQMLLLNAQRRAGRRRILLVSLIAAAIVLIAAGSIFAYVNSHNSTSQATPTEQVFNSNYPPVDGIYCDQLEQTSYHIHAHLTIYLNGQPVSLPQGVGIASDQSCLYWLHTHDGSGVIHIEAPKKVSPTLADFLDIWGQEFSSLGFHNELASSAGWTIYVDGKQVNSTFNQLVLQSHMVITIAYNSPGITPDTTYNWQAGQ